MSDLKKLGTKTPKSPIYKDESHKLCQSFPVETGVIIRAGEPVVLKTDGTITTQVKDTEASGTLPYIGIATSFSVDSPYPDKEQTVKISGFAIVWGIAGTGGITPGYVKPATGTDAKYTTYVASTTATSWIAINSASADEAVQIICK